MRAAVEDMRQVVAILPNHAVYRSNLAVLLNYSGEFSAAEEEIRKIESPDAARARRACPEPAGAGTGPRRRRDLPEAQHHGLRWGKSFGPAGLADIAVYEGRFSEAVKLLEDGAAADLTAKKRMRRP